MDCRFCDSDKGKEGEEKEESTRIWYRFPASCSYESGKQANDEKSGRVGAVVRGKKGVVKAGGKEVEEGERVRGMEEEREEGMESKRERKKEEEWRMSWW